MATDDSQEDDDKARRRFYPVKTVQHDNSISIGGGAINQ
jgi:hypothetical protein